MTVKIDENKCQGINNCGTCFDACALNMLQDVDNTPKPKVPGCVDWGLCIIACPSDAISK